MKSRNVKTYTFYSKDRIDGENPNADIEIKADGKLIATTPYKGGGMGIIDGNLVVGEEIIVQNCLQQKSVKPNYEKKDDGKEEQLCESDHKFLAQLKAEGFSGTISFTKRNNEPQSTKQVAPVLLQDSKKSDKDHEKKKPKDRIINIGRPRTKIKVTDQGFFVNGKKVDRSSTEADNISFTPQSNRGYKA